MKHPNVQIQTATVRERTTTQTVPTRGGIGERLSHRARPDTPPASDSATSETVAQLRAKLERYQGGRAKRAGWAQRFVASGLAPLDDVLPGGGVPCGGVTEILSDTPGVGAMTIAMRIALRASVDESFDHRQDAGATQEKMRRSQTGARRKKMHRLQTGATQEKMHRSQTGATQEVHQDAPYESASLPLQLFIIFVDTVGDFYPPAAWGVGIDPARLIVVRPGSTREAFWVVDQCLRCPGVAAVVAPLSKLDQLQSRRLQLAAESSGAVGLILRPARQTGHSFGSVRMLVEGVSTSEIERFALATDRSEMVLCRVTLLSVREGNPAGPVLMDLNHVTGACDLYSVPVDRPVARVG